jgi:hypothetical protein
MSLRVNSSKLVEDPAGICRAAGQLIKVSIGLGLSPSPLAAQARSNDKSLCGNNCSETYPAGNIFKGFTLAPQIIGWKVPVRISDGNGHDNPFCFRYFCNFS